MFESLVARALVGLAVIAVGAVADNPSIIPQTVQLGFVHDMCWDATRSRLLVSSGSSVVVVNPETAQIEDTITLGAAAGRIAISDDGRYLYTAIGSRGVIQRFKVQTHELDLTITLGADSQGRWLTAAAMSVLPGHPDSIIVARGPWSHSDNAILPAPSDAILVYDGVAQRPASLALSVLSLYLSPSDLALYAWGPSGIYRLSVGVAGVDLERTIPVDVSFSQDTLPRWGGDYLTDRAGTVYDLKAGVPIGRAALAQGCAIGVNGTGIWTAEGKRSSFPASLTLYGFDTYGIRGSVEVQNADSFLEACDSNSRVVSWGADGFAIGAYGNSAVSTLVLLRASGLGPVSVPDVPLARVDGSGVIQLAVTANDLIYDASRNLVWLSIPGTVGQIGNNVISVDPGSGKIVDTVYAGSEPGGLAISSDNSRLYVASRAVPSVSVLDLEAKTRLRQFPVLDGQSWRISSIAAVPGHRDSVIVNRCLTNNSYGCEVVAYDGDVSRARRYSNIKPDTGFVDPNLVIITSVNRGDDSASLYGANLLLHHGNGSYDIVQLIVEDNGVRLDHRLPNLQLGDTSYVGVQKRNLVAENGRLFTSGGEVRSSDGQSLLGTVNIQQSYASSGMPIPLSDRNQVVYLYHSRLAQRSEVTVFDLETLRPTNTLQLQAAPSTGVRAGGDRVAFLSDGLTILPLASIPASPQPPPGLNTIAPGVSVMRLKVNALNALPGTSKLVLALPGEVGNLGNSIAILNTDNGAIESSGYIGSEPTMLRTAADGRSAYVYLEGEQAVARYDIASAKRDLRFIPNPTGGPDQYPLVDMALTPDEVLIASCQSGWVAAFDQGVLRPIVDKNEQGPGAFSGATYELALSDDGTKVYAHDADWSFSDFKREAILADGIHYLSGAMRLLSGQMRSSGGLIFTSAGLVVDPERSRIVARLPLYSSVATMIAPDLAAGRIYLISGSQIAVFDSRTYEMIAARMLDDGIRAQSLVRYGRDGLAFHTTDGQLYLIQISAIPPLAKPVSAMVTTLPSTPGVKVVDLAALGLAYDATRDRLYVSTPNSEMANGDQIFALDPADGSVKEWRPGGPNPRVLAVADDGSRLFAGSGTANLGFSSGFSIAPEQVHEFLLDSGDIEAVFPAFPDYPKMSYGALDLVALPGLPRTVAMIDYWTQSVGGGVGTAPNVLRIFDAGVARKKGLLAHTFSCSYLVAGADATRLYCSDGKTITRLTVDDDGVTKGDSIPLLPGKGTFGYLAFRDGRVFTTTGNVVDVEAGRVVARVSAGGPVAIDGDRVYWLVPSGQTTTLDLLIYDRTTLKQIGSKRINVSAPDADRLVPCGQGRLAFHAGKEVYIVTP